MKYIFIFLNNKIISCDTILPFINDLKTKSNTKIVFYVFDMKTFNFLRENININNLINSNGKLVFFGFHQKYKFIRVFLRIIHILIIILISIFQKTANIHCGYLEGFPFNLIYLFNKKNTFLFESNCWGYSELTNNVASLFYKNRVSEDLKQLKAYNNLVCFNKDWPQYKIAQKTKKNIFLINSTRTTNNWLDECQRQAKILKQENSYWLSQINKSKRSIIYILGYLGKLPTLHKNETGETLFRETIKILIEETDLVILLKPHAITDIKNIRSILDEYASDRVHIIYNHIAILSHFCDYSISNYFSLTIPDVWTSGVKTIEYTHYDEEVMILTKSNTLRPKYVDVFINKDPDLLRFELKKDFIKKKRTLKNIKFDDTKLLQEKFL